MNTQPFFIPEEPVCHDPVLLSGPIAAIQVLLTENGRQKLGLLSRLPAGAILHLCGEGFDELTTKVRVDGRYYFVFREELDRRAH
jgi:hypothetical protein